MRAFQRGDVVEGLDVRTLGREVDEQDVRMTDGPLDACEKHEPACLRIRGVECRIEVAIVRSDRERVIPESSGPIDQLARRMPDGVERIDVRVGVQFDFEHGVLSLRRPEPSPSGGHVPCARTAA